MQLPTEKTDRSERYSIVLSTQTYAESPSDALSVFFEQLSTGQVGVEIHNSATNEAHDLSRLNSQNMEDQLELGIALVERHVSKMSAHKKLSILGRLRKALEA